MPGHHWSRAGLAVALIFSTSMAIAGLATTACGDTPAAVPTVHYHTVKVDGIDIFYREAGPADAPAVLLLHGFPTSSHMFRNLIPTLADRYHVIAPDYPGFGQSGALVVCATDAAVPVADTRTGTKSATSAAAANGQRRRRRLTVFSPTRLNVEQVAAV